MNKDLELIKVVEELNKILFNHSIKAIDEKLELRFSKLHDNIISNKEVIRAKFYSNEYSILLKAIQDYNFVNDVINVTVDDGKHISYLALWREEKNENSYYSNISDLIEICNKSRDYLAVRLDIIKSVNISTNFFERLEKHLLASKHLIDEESLESLLLIPSNSELRKRLNHMYIVFSTTLVIKSMF